MDNNYSDDEEAHQQGIVKLKSAINLDSILKGQTFEINFDQIQADEEYNPKDIDVTEFSGASLGIDSDEDDEDINSTPFEKLAGKMIDVTKDGKIKKRVKRKGTGETPPDNALVSIHYTSYLEYSDEPTDYAYAKKSYQFRLGSAVVFGLNFAVASMKVNEKSHFLIHHDYAFGEMGHPPRIPACSTFLFQVELLRFVDSGAALELNKLSIEEKSQFPIAYKTALALTENGKECFKHNVRIAIREYNKAATLLEACNLSDMSEQEKQQKLLFKLYSNLAICYNVDNNPKKCCTMCNNIYRMTKNTSLKIPAKVFFNNGRALLMLGDYPRAKEKLLCAQNLEPHNKDISNELAKISVKLQEDIKRERQFAKALIQNKDPVKKVPLAPKVDDNFTTEIRNLCESLLANEEQTQFKLPGGLTVAERDATKFEAEKLGLKFRESKHNENDGKLAFFVTKM